MTRALVVALAATALLVLGPGGSAAQAQPRQPTIFLEADCTGDTPYGGFLHVAGLEPNTEYLLLYGIGGGGHYFTTDASGSRPFVGGFGSSEPFEQTVRIYDHTLSGDEQLVLEAHFTVDRPCEDIFPDPTAKSQCKNGGWHNFPDFKNQGQCIKFVKRGP